MYEIKERVRYSEVRENGKMDLLGVVQKILVTGGTFRYNE